VWHHPAHRLDSSTAAEVLLSLITAACQLKVALLVEEYVVT